MISVRQSARCRLIDLSFNSVADQSLTVEMNIISEPEMKFEEGSALIRRL
jgi:hypothetical protein